MQCFKPIVIDVKSNGKKIAMTVPCGKCMGCRIALRREWSVRIMHELDSFGSIGSFITLTYSDINLPENGTLRKDHWQKFMKRLRKYYPDKKIRFYACGEYGGEKKRPHYHAIIFGISLDDLEAKRVNNRLISRVIERLWRDGFNVVGTVTTDSAQYVAGYIEKKLTGEAGEEEYEKTGRIAPFSLCSQGIGKNYCEANSEQIKQLLNITVKGKNVGIPRYYKKRINLDQNALYDKGEEQRKKIHDRYELYYQQNNKNGDGEKAVDILRREIASYRYEALRARIALKTRTLDKDDGSIDPSSNQAKRG